MFDPSKVLSQILTNLTTKAQPSRPQLPSLFDYFVKNCSADLIDPVVITKWTENCGNIEMTRMINESSFSDEGVYPVPVSFFNEVAVEVFESLSDADRLDIQRANERAYHDAVIKYQDKMKKLYRSEGTEHGKYGALEMAAYVLEPVMAALEALTDLHVIGWAGGTVSSCNGIGIIKISGQCGGPTEAPMIFPRSETELIRYAAQQWMGQVDGQIIEQWLGTSQYTTTERGVARIVTKRKHVGHDIRIIKKTAADTANNTVMNSAEISSLSRSPIPEFTQRSVSTALQDSSSDGQMIGSHDFVVCQASLLPCFALPTPTKTPLPGGSAPQMLNKYQTSSSYMRHRSESLPPILTLNQDEGSTTHRSRVARSASEDLSSSEQKRDQKKNDAGMSGHEEFQSYYSSLIATVPTSAKNLRMGLKTVIRVDLGTSVREIVTSLIEIETLHGFRSPHKGLPTGLRPREVSNWIATGRGRQGGSIKVVDIEKFSEAWWNWWTDMQPTWRGHDAHGKPKRMIPVRIEEEEWRSLDKPGANGMISVVAGLYGWGVAIKKQTVHVGLGEIKADWLCAVEDCRWAMERLIKYLQKKQEEGRSDRHRSEEDELDVETMDCENDSMQEDRAHSL